MDLNHILRSILLLLMDFSLRVSARALVTSLMGLAGAESLLQATEGDGE